MKASALRRYLRTKRGNTAWRLLVEGYEDKKYCYKGEGGALCLARTR